ncbi:MAG: hypothetical protein R2836_00490 [Chitinophagales bacterium]
MKVEANTNYIEFYDNSNNDGKLDTKLYRDTAWQMHDRYSLFTDEAIYYLTWNTNAGNRILPCFKRFNPIYHQRNII